MSSITPEERQEVAAKLRELRHRTYYREEIVESICDAISIADPVNTFREPEDVYELLADLIDPTKYGGMYESRELYTNSGEGYAVCKECHAKEVARENKIRRLDNRNDNA